MVERDERKREKEKVIGSVIFIEIKRDGREKYWKGARDEEKKEREREKGKVKKIIRNSELEKKEKGRERGKEIKK